MGSYLTIVNNTPDMWQCKIGPDTQALKYFAIVFGAIAAALAALTIVGIALAATSVVVVPSAVTAVATANTMLVTGLPASAVVASAEVVGAGAGIFAGASFAVLAQMSFMAALGAGTTAFGLGLTSKLMDKLTLKGYKTIMPGQSHRYGKMTLSLWQQSVCIKIKTGGAKVAVDTLTMRPIFSGAKANSNREYDIQTWIKKRGVKSDVIEGKTNPPQDKSGMKTLADVVKEEEDNKEKHRLLGGNDKIEYRFFPNGTAYNVETGAIYLKTETFV